LSRQGQRVYLHAGSSEEAGLLDRLLWSFVPESFVPHTLATDPQAAEVPVVIGCSGMPAGCSCLLNLGDEPVMAQTAPEAVAEFVTNDAEARERSRTRWSFYKQQGWELQLHQL